MSTEFQTVAIVARRQSETIADTVMAVEQLLQEKAVNIVFEDATAHFLPAAKSRTTLPRADLGAVCDLVVVVGGDGSLLGVSREIAPFGVPVVGVNRGGLGFLAAIAPDDLGSQLGSILDGRYNAEDHFLLQAYVLREGQEVARSNALNDVVIHAGNVAHMMEFELWVDDEYVYDQRSDGLIVASPTGSTAYALSAGGPIMHPALDAIVVVPMFPHTLTSRPLVIPGEAGMRVKVLQVADSVPELSFDSQVSVKLAVGDEVLIGKFPSPLKLLYPTGHSFYESCRSKLDWATRLGGTLN